MAETDSDHLVNAQLDLIGIVDENPSSKKEDEGADEQCWSLVPVQDEKSDQSNTAPKRIVIPEDGCKLGRNPFTGVMDALVSRDLLHIFFEGNTLYLKALRTPNKVTLGGEYCLVDELNKYELEKDTVLSLYSDKYRYIVTKGSKKDLLTSSAASPSVNKVSGTNSGQENSSGAKASTPYGFKVAPAAAKDDKRSSRRISKMDSTPVRQVVVERGHSANYMQWAIFVVVSGCLIAIVYIIGRNTDTSGSDIGAATRMLRGGR